MLRFFSADSSLSLSLSLSCSLSLASPLTSLHPLPHHMPKATTINMIGPPHKRRRAIIWTGMTRGKWNWFWVYRSVWVYILCALECVYLCVCVSVCVKIVFRFFHQVWAVWRIWEAMACRTERFLPSLVTVAKETNTGSPLLLTQSKQRGTCHRCKCVCRWLSVPSWWPRCLLFSTEHCIWHLASITRGRCLKTKPHCSIH